MLRKIISIVLSFNLILAQSGLCQGAFELNLGQYLGQMNSGLAMDKFRPLHLRYFSYDTATNNFQLLLDKGDNPDIKDEELQDKTKVLMEYFQVGLSLSNDKFWVNLRPDSEDEIIDPLLERTGLGKVMLESDLQLKKDTAAFTSPQSPEGRLYWDKLYQKARELFGSEPANIPTLTRPWIVPGEIIVKETDTSAYIYKANMKVMLEEDYLKTTNPINSGQMYTFSDPRMKELNAYSTQLIREMILPKLTKDVNTAKRYAALRQVFFSLVMARWFKERFRGKSGEYPQTIDSNNLEGLTSKEPWSKSFYFNEYKKSFENGEYNLKEQIPTISGQVIRSYVSGGMKLVSSSPLGSNKDEGLFSGSKHDMLKTFPKGLTPLKGDSFKMLNINPWPGLVIKEIDIDFDKAISLTDPEYAFYKNEIGLLKEDGNGYRIVVAPWVGMRDELGKVSAEEWYSSRHEATAVARHLSEIYLGKYGLINGIFGNIKPQSSLKEAEDRFYRDKEIILSDGTINRRRFPGHDWIRNPAEGEIREAARKIAVDAFGLGEVLEGVLRVREEIAAEKDESNARSSSPLADSEKNIGNWYEAGYAARFLRSLSNNKPNRGLITTDSSNEALAFLKVLGAVEKKDEETIILLGDKEILSYKEHSDGYVVISDNGLTAVRLQISDKDIIIVDGPVGTVKITREPMADVGYLFTVEKVDRGSEVKPDSSSAGSPVVENRLGGIDFRQMDMLIQPMGSFSGLNFSLPVLSAATLEAMDLDKELEDIRNMAKAGVIPSGERVKEYLAACFQKGRMAEKQDDLLLCLSEIYRLQEEEVLETSPELRESLVIVETGNFVLTS